VIARGDCQIWSVSQSPLGLLALGFALGLRHALDVDHLVAVSTIVSERRGLRDSWRVGALWGAGHTVALFAVALVVISLRAEIPPALAHWLEIGVAAMLVGLGANLLWKLARGATVHAHVHAHGDRVHVHPHLHDAHAHQDEHDYAIGHAHHAHEAAHHPAPLLGRRSLLVGMMHGLAGSAALMLAVLATVPTPGLALAYVATFGVGSIAGMMATSALVALPLGLLASRLRGAERALQGTVGATSVGVGLAMAFGG
jgi:ABC-type nickel/cobalt efflux system permease component RcnA